MKQRNGRREEDDAAGGHRRGRPADLWSGCVVAPVVVVGNACDGPRVKHGRRLVPAAAVTAVAMAAAAAVAVSMATVAAFFDGDRPSIRRGVHRVSSWVQHLFM